MTNLIYCRKNYVLVSIFVAGVFLASAFLFLSTAGAAEEAQIQAAIKDLNSTTGQNITSQVQAQALCNQEQYLDTCADIGKKHELYTPDQVKQVDDFLNEVKGKILNDIKTCSDEECLVRVAGELAQKLKSKNSTLATDFNLTSKIVEEKNAVVQAAKDAGVSFRDCEAMNPDTASVDLLRKCAKLAKDSRVQKYIPEEKRVLAAEFGDSATFKLKEALAAGKYQCGDGTLDGCGNFCLNPTGTAGIPPVCAQIASEIFGAEGVKQLEAAHRQVGQVKDHYSKKFILTLPNGKELVGENQIRSTCEQAFSNHNLEVARACGSFAINNGFAAQAEVDKGLKLMESFNQKGGDADFNTCLTNPESCRDFIPEGDRARFDAGSQIFQIMRTEIGFDPSQCERGSVDQAIGMKCFEGSKRALAQIEGLGLANQSQEARFIIEEIKGHVAEGENMTQRRDEFNKVFTQQGGPGGCRSEAECFTYCSNSVNGAECIAFGAKQGVSGFRGEEAIQKFQEYNQNIQRSSDVTSNEYRSYPSDSRYPQYPGQGQYPQYPGYQPPGQDPRFTQPGPGYNPPPGTMPYYPPGPGPTGPSPECFAAVQSGDFVKAKAVCEVHTSQQPYPSAQVCPASPYVECPAGQYRDSYRNPDGCWVDGPCKTAPTYSPYPTYTGNPYPTYSPGPGNKPQCSDGIDNDSDGKTDYPADHSCYGSDDSDEYYPQEGGPYPTYSTYPTPGISKCPSEFAYDMGGYCKLNDDKTNTKCAAYSIAGNKANYSSDCSKLACPSGQWWDYSKNACVGGGTTYTPYPTYSYSPYPTATGGGGSMYSCFYPNATKNGTPPGYTVWCEKDYFNCHEGSNTGPSISLDGLSLGAPSSCESGYQGKSCNNNKFCDSNETYTSCPSDCGGATYSPYPTYSPGPVTGSCPSGYHPHGDSGGYCMNDQENFSGTCYNSAGTSKIACPVQPTYSPYPSSSPTSSGSCPSGSYVVYVNNAGGYCQSNTDSTKCGPLNSTGVSNFGSCSSYQTTATPWPVVGSCTSGQYWDAATSSCKTSSYTSSPGPSTSSTPWPVVGSCTSGQYWDAATSSCKTTSTATYSPAPGASYTPYPSCPSGQWWDTATSKCTSTTTSCGTGYYWDAVSNMCKPSGSTTYTPYPSYTPYPTVSAYYPPPTESYSPPPSTPPPGAYTPPPTYSAPPAYSPPPAESYSPPPPPPPPTSVMYQPYMIAHCQQLGRTWNGSRCQANGLFVRFYEGSGMANILRLFYIVP